MPNTKPDTGGIPDALRRNPDNTLPGDPPKAATMTSTKPVTPQVAAPAGSTPLGVPDQPKPNRATRRAAAKATKQAAPKAKTAKPKAAKPAKPAKVEAEDTDDEAGLPKSIVPAKYKQQYAATQDTCGSALSLALKDATTHKSKEQAGRVVLDVDALWKIAARNKVDVTKYVDLNNGQKRMNVYNRLVGLLNNGTDVRIGAQVFRAEDWQPKKAAAPKAKKATKATKAKTEQPQAHAA